MSTRRIEYLPTISNLNEYWESFVTISLLWTSLQGIFSFLSLTIRCILLYILFRSIQFLLKFPSAYEFGMFVDRTYISSTCSSSLVRVLSLNMYYKFRHAFLRGVTNNSFRSYATIFIQWSSQEKEHSDWRLKSCPINDYLNNFHDTPPVHSGDSTLNNAFSHHTWDSLRAI